MHFTSPFYNPFTTPWQHDVRNSCVTSRRSLQSDATFVFDQGYRHSLSGLEHDKSCESTTVFENEFRNDLGQANLTAQSPCTSRIHCKGNNIANTGHQHKASIETTAEDNSPLILGLRRVGNSNITEIYDPLNDQTIYSIRDVERGHLSRGHDLEIDRAISGDFPLAVIKYGLRTLVTSVSTGLSFGTIDKFQSSSLDESMSGETLSWKVKKHGCKPKWIIKEGADGKYSSQLQIRNPLLTLGLTNQGRPHSQPLCIVRMYTVRPVGVIEVWMKSARIDREGGDWAALDELVISAYANMEKARRQLFHGEESWLFMFLLIAFFVGFHVGMAYSFGFHIVSSHYVGTVAVSKAAAPATPV